MLRITKQTDYGIVLMTCFAIDENRRVQNARDVARDTRLPLPTVSKILKALARGGVLVSHRGVKGGYSLARPPEAITIEEIITALEGPIAITACCDDGCDCDIERSCPVRVPWQRINGAVVSALRGIPLSEMVAGTTRVPRPAASAAANAPGTANASAAANAPGTANASGTSSASAARGKGA